MPCKYSLRSCLSFFLESPNTRSAIVPHSEEMTQKSAIQPMVLRPRFFAILAGSKMYRHKRTVRTTSNNIRDNVADKVSSFIKIELNNIDLIDRCKVTTFFRKCSKCRARSGRKMRNNKPHVPKGSLHTALRKAKRHVGCQA